jgi:uncharacterized protein (TIGR02597 family)
VVNMIDQLEFDTLSNKGNFTLMKALCQTRALLLAFTLGAGLSHAGAQSVATSTPVGYTTTAIKGRNGGTNSNNFFSIGLTREEAWRGVPNGKSVNGEGRTVITVNGGPLAGMLTRAGGGQDHYLQVVTGPNAGASSDILANTDSQITIADNFDDIITPASTIIRVVPHWTLSTVFPSGGGLGGGVSPTLADTVTLYPPAGSPVSYFYHSASGQWRRGLSNESHAKIPPGCGVMVTRKQPGDVQITISGTVTTSPVEVEVGGAATNSSGGGRMTLVANPHPADSLSLGSSGLFTGNTNTGVVGGVSPLSADTVTIYSPTNGVGVNYFYHSGAGQWRRGLSNASAVTIPQGGAVMVTRKSGRPGFSWYVPSPVASLTNNPTP